jgi:hypothetical protein
MTRTRPQGFGARTWNLDCMVAGTMPLDDFLSAQEALVNFLGMDTANMPPDIRTFPLPDGRGGEGQSIFQPFVEPLLFHQPLTTSFIIFDIWPEHFTVTIKSCLQFDPAAVVNEISRSLGPILDCHHWTLGLVKPQTQACCAGVGDG